MLILAWAGTGCGSDPNRTGLRMQVSLGGLVIDQLEFTVTASSGIKVDHVRRPEAPSGPLTDHQVIEIYLRDDLAGGGVTCDVVGMSANTPRASDRKNAKVVAGLLVPVAISLGGAAKDGGADDASPDGKTDADAARDVAADADIDANADVPPPVDSGDNEAGVKPLGTACVTADECASGVCVDGVCCTSTCSVCHACNITGKEGTCQPSPAGTKATPCVDQKIPCGYNGTCDGQGACFRPMAGQMCSPATCQGSTLLPPSACDGQGVCQPAIPVACAPFNCDSANGPHCRNNCTVAADCVATAACTNSSCGPKPKKANGAGCVAASECMSNVCVDGVCCNMNCTGACMACNLAGQAGNCRPVPSGKSDPHNVCKDMGAASCGTNGQCDGSGGCLHYPVGSICESPQCLAHAIVGAKKCAAGGTCMATVSTDCSPYKCDPANTMCFTSCTTNADCAVATGKACKNGMCR